MTHRAPIALASYDPRWAAMFEAERRSLRSLLALVRVRIEHIGSTAVPGLRAKPIVDVMLGCARISELEARIPTLEEAGWEYVTEHEDQFPQRRFLAKPNTRPRQFHLHAVETATDFWSRHLLFRDYLRSHADVASAYERLKLSLAATFGDDRDAYTEAKTSFIEDVLEKAAEEAARSGARRPTIP